MNTFWTTLLEINLILSITYLGYRVLLKNLTFFRWTRVYLLGGMLLGLLYPFLKTQQVVHTPAEGVNIAIPDISQVAQTPGLDYNQWAIYALTALFAGLGLRFLIRFFSLGKIHFASDKAEFNGLAFRNTRRQLNPFSFWKWIYIHRNSHSDFEMKQIIAHEHIHTRQRHTFDVLMAEICTIICWYNPLVKLLSKAVKDNLEFLVDAEVLHSGIDRVSYQHSLVGISLSGFPQPRHGNQFAFKTLKRRIYMMNKNQSPKSRLIAYMLMTPLVLAFAGLLTFSCQKESLDTIAKAKESEGIVWERTVTASYDKEQEKSTIEKVELKTTGAVQGISFEAKSMETDQQGSITLNEPVTLKAVSSSESPLWILDGEPIEGNTIKEISPNSIESINVLKNASATAIYGEKAKHGVILITTKKGHKGSQQ